MLGASSQAVSGADPSAKEPWRDIAHIAERRKDRWRAESEIGRRDRWLEEERESGFVGSRHDRWKEEEREGRELRKGDRWADGPLLKEPGKRADVYHHQSTVTPHLSLAGISSGVTNGAQKTKNMRPVERNG